MKRLTISVEDDDYRALRRIHAEFISDPERKDSMTAVVQEAIRHYISSREEEKAR